MLLRRRGDDHSQSTFDHALALARRLSVRDQARLIAQIAEELAEATLPTITHCVGRFHAAGADGRHWADDLPLSRKGLYGDDERG
jgi:hypothetical protein